MEPGARKNRKIAAPGDRMTDFLSRLNPEQLKAVTLPRQSALILAGAGSGKTRVLTTRIAYLDPDGRGEPGGHPRGDLHQQGAREMLTRLSAMLPINTRGMWVGTFHGLCNRLLRAHIRDAGLPQLFQIMDSGDQQSLIKRLAKAQGIDEEKFPPRQLQKFINNCKEAGCARMPSKRATSSRGAWSPSTPTTTRSAIAKASSTSPSCCCALRAPLAQPTLLEHYQRRFRYILVDEFQDTNKLQYRWIKMLAGGGRCVFAVGDDDQSIYRFRGAKSAT
jgi:DNA helicase-2/ATP-dependent DNA helicase PcrA